MADRVVFIAGSPDDQIRRAMVPQQMNAEVESAEAEDVDPESRCEAVVTSLQRHELEPEERRTLILEAEVLPFRGQQAAELVPLLRRFIEMYRESDDPADLVAVGSAIRNYVATAPVGDALEAAASLLKEEGELEIPIELEVEVTKMVVRKLTANPPRRRSVFRVSFAARGTRRCLCAAATTSSREVWSRCSECHPGFVLSRSGRDADVVERMRTLDVAWFQQLLARYAARLREELIARDAEAKFADVGSFLEQLSTLDSWTCGEGSNGVK